MRRLLLVLSLLPVACAAPGSSGNASEDLTNITPSDPVEQAIPDCWAYATTSWIESLAERPDGGVRVDLSEGYISYLHWFTQIVAGASTVRPTGVWSNAVEVSRLYGFVSEQDFLNLSGPPAYAARHATAFNALNHELASGELHTTAQRADANHVVSVLNRVWQLTPAIAKEMSDLFGEGFERHLDNDVIHFNGSHFHSLTEIPVGYGPLGDLVTVSDLVGVPKEGIDPFYGVRVGKYAVSEVKPPIGKPDLRGYLRRAQLALNQDLPVVMSLWQQDDLVDRTGTFAPPPSGSLDGSAYGHEVNIFDLTVDTQDYGLIEAGVRETRPNVLAATLRDDSFVRSFRAQNSYWGTYQPGSKLPFAMTTGTNDYDVEYLFAPTPSSTYAIKWLVLPNDPSIVLSK